MCIFIGFDTGFADRYEKFSLKKRKFINRKFFIVHEFETFFATVYDFALERLINFFVFGILYITKFVNCSKFLTSSVSFKISLENIKYSNRENSLV